MKKYNIRIQSNFGCPKLIHVNVYKEFEFNGFKFFIHRKVIGLGQEVSRCFGCCQYDTGHSISSYGEPSVISAYKSALKTLESHKSIIEKGINDTIEKYGRANPSLTGL